MLVRVLLIFLSGVVLFSCQRQTAFFQPAARLTYQTPIPPAAAPVFVSADSVYTQTQVEAGPEVPLVTTATATQPARRILQPARQQQVLQKAVDKDEGAGKRIRPADESPARRPARNSLIAGLLGIAGLAVALLVPNASILLLLAPVAGVWALVAAIKAFNRSQKGAPERSSATVGLILGSLLLLVTIFFALALAAWGGAFQ